MRTNFLSILLASLIAFSLLGCQEDNKKPSTPIAVINQVDVYEKSTTIKAARDHLNATFEKLSKEMTVLNELADKEKDKEKAKKMVEEGILDAQRRFEAEEQLVTSKVSAVVEKTIKECREELGATIIISTDLLVDYDKQADISDKVIAKIDKQTISFADPDISADDAADAKAAPAASKDDKTGDAAGNGKNGTDAKAAEKPADTQQTETKAKN